MSEYGVAITGVRAGRHDCYDRLVIDVRGVRALTTWHAAYVSGVTADPSGRPVTLRGGRTTRRSGRRTN